MSERYSMVRVDDVEQKPSQVSGTSHVDLVEELGTTEMRPKVWYLSPGDALSHHRQTEQEEFYYVLEGPARIRIDGDEPMDVEEGTAIRIPPETPRQVLNDTAGEHVWLIIGAPNVEGDGRPASDE
jgi:quercetin dioxygenase-like cupin family protein